MRVIVSEHRSHHGKLPVFRAPSAIRHKAVRETEPQPPFVPHPVGTIRGPYLSDSPEGKNTNVQYCVQTLTGWVYYIRRLKYQTEAKQLAEEKAKEVLAAP
jgi:hypothetical protein